MSNFNVMEYLKNKKKEQEDFAKALEVKEEDQIMSNLNRCETEMELTHIFGGAY